MTGQADMHLGGMASSMEEGLPHGPMAMPEQQLERRWTFLASLRLPHLPVLVRSRTRMR